MSSRYDEVEHAIVVIVAFLLHGGNFGQLHGFELSRLKLPQASNDAEPAGEASTCLITVQPLPLSHHRHERVDSKRRGPLLGPRYRVFVILDFQAIARRLQLSIRFERRILLSAPTASVPRSPPMASRKCSSVAS